MKKCPYCAEEIQDEAILCRYCHCDVQTIVLSPAGSPRNSRATALAQGPLQRPETHQKAVTWLVIGFAAVPIFFITARWSNVLRPEERAERIYPVKFEGSSAVVFPHDQKQSLGREFTLECWYRVDGASASEWIGLISKSDIHSEPGRGYSLRLRWQPGRSCPNKVVFTLYGTDVELSRDFDSELGVWNHVAVAADSYNGALKLFMNGKYLRHLDGKAVSHADVPRFPRRIPRQSGIPLVIGGEGERLHVLRGAMFDVRISNVDRLHTAFVPQYIDRFDGRTVFLARLREGKGSRTEEEVTGMSVSIAGLWDENGPMVGRSYHP